jgi:hypothetical protein
MEKLSVKSERYMKGDIGTYARGAAAEIEAIRMILTSCATMSIDKEDSINMIRSAPWLIAYRIERSKRVIAVLAVSLGMAKAEVAKCVRLYPRILCLSPDGKLNQLLRYLAEVAAAFLDRKYKNISPNVIEKYMKLKNDFYDTSIIMDGDIYDDKVLEKMDDDMVKAALINRRSNPIRTMVRYLIIKYPLILGISLERISDRYDELSEYKDVEWSDLIPFLRRYNADGSNIIEESPESNATSSLFVIDVQDDFILPPPGLKFLPKGYKFGRFNVEDGANMTQALGAFIVANMDKFTKVIFSRDTHTTNHCSFGSSGGPFPNHCIANHIGSKFHDHIKLPQIMNENTKKVDVIFKGCSHTTDSFGAV